MVFTVVGTWLHLTNDSWPYLKLKKLMNICSLLFSNTTKQGQESLVRLIKKYTLLIRLEFLSNIVFIHHNARKPAKESLTYIILTRQQCSWRMFLCAVYLSPIWELTDKTLCGSTCAYKFGFVFPKCVDIRGYIERLTLPPTRHYTIRLSPEHTTPGKKSGFGKFDERWCRVLPSAMTLL